MPQDAPPVRRLEPPQRRSDMERLIARLEAFAAGADGAGADGAGADADKRATSAVLVATLRPQLETLFPRELIV